MTPKRSSIRHFGPQNLDRVGGARRCEGAQPAATSEPGRPTLDEHARRIRRGAGPTGYGHLWPHEPRPPPAGTPDPAPRVTPAGPDAPGPADVRQSGARVAITSFPQVGGGSPGHAPGLGEHRGRCGYPSTVGAAVGGRLSTPWRSRVTDDPKQALTEAFDRDLIPAIHNDSGTDGAFRAESGRPSARGPGRVARAGSVEDASRPSPRGDGTGRAQTPGDDECDEGRPRSSRRW